MEWRSVKGYKGIYEVSNTGLIRSVKSGRVLKAHNNGGGYMKLFLCKNGIKKHCYVHIIVAENFKRRRQGETVVNHKDNIKHNNDSSNLEWCTQSYNIKYWHRNKHLY